MRRIGVFGKGEAADTFAFSIPPPQGKQVVLAKLIAKAATGGRTGRTETIVITLPARLLGPAGKEGVHNWSRGTGLSLLQLGL